MEVEGGHHGHVEVAILPFLLPLVLGISVLIEQRCECRAGCTEQCGHCHGIVCFNSLRPELEDENEFEAYCPEILCQYVGNICTTGFVRLVTLGI